MKYLILIFMLSVFSLVSAAQKDYSKMSKKELLQEKKVVDAMLSDMDEMQKIHKLCQKNKNDAKCKNMKPPKHEKMEVCRKDRKSAECKKMRDKMHEERQKECIKRHGKDICQKIGERKKEEREKFKGKGPKGDMPPPHKKGKKGKCPKEFKKHMERKYKGLKEEKAQIEKALKGKK